MSAAFSGRILRMHRVLSGAAEQFGGGSVDEVISAAAGLGATANQAYVDAHEALRRHLGVPDSNSVIRWCQEHSDQVRDALIAARQTVITWPSGTTSAMELQR